MKSIESTYLTALCLRQELLFYRDAYSGKGVLFFELFMKLKPLLIALTNTKEFIDGISFYVRDNENIRNKRKQITQRLECCRYLRNKICGHLDDEFCEMAKKWAPASLLKLESFDSPELNIRWSVNMFTKALIESAINSFRIDNPTQSFFSSEIDILYPPNNVQLMNFIEVANENCIQLLSDIADHLRPNINFYNGVDGAMDAIKEAAKMDFGTKE